jgi:hypothetical protein
VCALLTADVLDDEVTLGGHQISVDAEAEGDAASARAREAQKPVISLLL